MTPAEMIPGYELRPAWRLRDPQIEADAVAYWRRLGILPPGVKPEQRAGELVAVAYRGDRLAGVHTAAIENVEQVRARLAILRSSVDPEFRRSHVSLALTLYSGDLLERWSRDNQGERLAGLGAYVEGEQLVERSKQPYWPQTRFMLAGYLPDGRQLRISWFDDYRTEYY